MSRRKLETDDVTSPPGALEPAPHIPACGIGECALCAVWRCAAINGVTVEGLMSRTPEPFRLDWQRVLDMQGSHR